MSNEEADEQDYLKPLLARNPDRKISVKRRMTIRRKDSTPSLPVKLSHPQVRAKIVEEILNTERDYVGNLQNIIEVGAGGALDNKLWVVLTLTCVPCAHCMHIHVHSLYVYESC